MGENTIREILRRRSPETQRAMQRRRELAGASMSHVSRLLILIVIAVVAVVAGVGYLGYEARGVSQRFAADRAQLGAKGGMTLKSTTEFLPNTLLADIDPAFYNSSGLSGTLLTRKVVHLFYPDASGIETRVMAVTLEAGYPKTAIMEAFINDVPMGGSDAHPVKGFAAASTYYFGKPFNLLGPQDIALLVAVAANPGLDPRQDPAQALSYRNIVLEYDKQQNVLAEAQVDGLTKLPLGVTAKPGA